MKKTFHTIFFFLIVFLLGGCDETELKHELWIAKTDMPVYATSSDIQDEFLFQINAGDTCTPVREVIKKVFLHTEILCRDGQGWITSRNSGFEVIKAKKKK